MNTNENKPESLEDHESDVVMGGGSKWDVSSVTTMEISADDVIRDSRGQITLIRT